MKALSILFLAGALLAGSAARAQNVDEIVKKHNEAMGGTEAWNKINSLKLIGSVNANGMEIPVTVTKVKDKGMRTDIEVMGTKGFVILTPTAGWMFMPFGNGQTKPEPMTPEMLKAQQGELDVVDDLMNYTAKGSKLEYVGKDDVDGTECFKLKLTDKDGNLTTLFIDPATYYTIREVQKVKADGKDMEQVSNLSNFQKLPEGIVVPMSMSGDQGNTTITKVEINTVKDDNIFKPETGKGG